MTANKKIERMVRLLWFWGSEVGRAHSDAACYERENVRIELRALRTTRIIPAHGAFAVAVPSRIGPKNQHEFAFATSHGFACRNRVPAVRQSHSGSRSAI